MPQAAEKPRILLVEDNAGDVRLVREALSEGGLDEGLDVVTDGEEALGFLRREDSYQDARRPALVLLDLNLPRKDGREVLREMKSTADLRSIPVVVLTTSRAEDDVRTAYDLQANCYVAKPVELDEFLGTIRDVIGFWLRTVRLPAS